MRRVICCGRYSPRWEILPRENRRVSLRNRRDMIFMIRGLLWNSIVERQRLREIPCSVGIIPSRSREKGQLAARECRARAATNDRTDRSFDQNAADLCELIEKSVWQD